MHTFKGTLNKATYGEAFTFVSRQNSFMVVPNMWVFRLIILWHLCCITDEAFWCISKLQQVKGFLLPLDAICIENTATYWKSAMSFYGHCVTVQEFFVIFHCGKTSITQLQLPNDAAGRTKGQFLCRRAANVGSCLNWLEVTYDFDQGALAGNRINCLRGDQASFDYLACLLSME